MKAFAVLFGILALGSVYWLQGNEADSAVDIESSLREKFLTFVANFDKSYLNAQEMERRFRIFVETLEEISSLNADEDDHATYDINHLSDWTSEEKDKLRGMNGVDKSGLETFSYSDLTLKNDEINWVEKGVTHSVKDQGSCGSCWAFSAIGPLEAAIAIRDGEIPDFSEQQLVDCSHEDRSAGCNGGEMTGAYQHA